MNISISMVDAQRCIMVTENEKIVPTTDAAHVRTHIGRLEDLSNPFPPPLHILCGRLIGTTSHVRKKKLKAERFHKS